MNTDRTMRQTAAILAAAALLGVAPAVAAETRVTPSKAAAVKAAKARAATLAKQTHASGYRVLGCKRSTSVRYACQIENSFSTGARRCAADVVVTFRAGGVRTSYSNYRCF